MMAFIVWNKLLQPFILILQFTLILRYFALQGQNYENEEKEEQLVRYGTFDVNDDIDSIRGSLSDLDIDDSSPKPEKTQSLQKYNTLNNTYDGDKKLTSLDKVGHKSEIEHIKCSKQRQRQIYKNKNLGEGLEKDSKMMAQLI